MRKEIALAIVIGIIVGLGITFGLFYARERLLPNRTAEEIESSRQQNPTPTPTLKTNLVVQQPKNNLLTAEKTIKVVGRALPDSMIVVLTDSNEYITSADLDGDFAVDIDLALGGNRVTVVATSPDGNQESVILSLVYSTVDLDAPPATEEGETEE